MTTLLPIKLCTVCGKPYGLNSRKPHQYRKSRFCSRICSGLAQRNTLQDVMGRLELDQKTGCHLWTGHRIQSGYGVVTIGRRQVLLHRLTWETYRGPVPEGLQLDHLCGVKACCNIDHLRVCTAQENSLAKTSNNMGARNARKTCCPKCQGPYSIRPNGNRYCKPCVSKAVLAYQREYRAERRKRRDQNKEKI